MKKFHMIILGCLYLATSLNGCGPQADKDTETQAVPVKAMTVTRGNITDNYTTVGSVEAEKTVNLAFKVPGRVARVYIRLGDYVQENQTLIELEKNDLINQNKQARAAFLLAQANFKQARENVERNEKLYRDNLISEAQYNGIKTACEAAEAQLNQAQVAVEITDNQLSNSEIKAPFSGYIGYCNVNQGEMITPGAPLMSVVQLARVFVTINLSDSYIGKVWAAQKVNVKIQAYPDESFVGWVDQIAPAINPITRMFPVRVKLDNTARKIKAGMLAEVRLGLNERRDVLLIPAEAVIDDIGVKSVYILDGVTAKRKVVTLGVTDGKMTEVLTGLREKDRIVVMGQNNLSEGTKVVVK
ncbi:MAG: efflux RND transporter periplasmic adaptor subunit [Bacillota bacterium]